MSMLTKSLMLGVDVAKEWLDLCDGTAHQRIDNTDADIRAYFDRQASHMQIAIEPTNRYHIRFMQHALAAGHHVYLVDAYKLSRYRDAIGVRAKTDIADAQLLLRYLQAEGTHLQPYLPVPEAVQHLNDLLRARGKLAKERASIRQSLGWIATLRASLETLLASLDQAMRDIDKQLEACLEQAGYQSDYKRCQRIPGVGPVVSTALVSTYHRGPFRKADAFIAYLGIDIRVRESGKHTGQRKLTKKGNAEIRRLLFNGAMAGARTSYWRDYYDRLRQRGLSSTAAYVAVGRKIARIAFALMRDQSDFVPER